MKKINLMKKNMAIISMAIAMMFLFTQNINAQYTIGTPDEATGNITNDDEATSGVSTTVAAGIITGSDSYQWDPAGSIGNNQSFTESYTTNTSYSVTITNGGDMVVQTIDVVVAAEPEMDISDGSGNAINDGANLAAASTTNNTDFGALDIAGPTLSFTYTITNSGNANLDLTGTPLVEITGTHASDFTVTAMPTDPLPHTSGNTTTFIVEFDPSAAGVREATISIANDDSDENPYDFVVKGMGLDFTNSFNTTWTTTGGEQSITIPTNSSLTYDYYVDWGDGSAPTHETRDATRTYGSANTYTVRIVGTFPAIFFNNAGDKTKITTIDQWGDNVWASMQHAFWGCTNLTHNATVAPNLTNVNHMGYMFNNVNAINGDLSGWDVSGVQVMSGVFGITDANPDVSSWVTSSANNMYQMFAGNTAFDQDISGWNVTMVGDFRQMFNGATAFDQDLGDWNISNATQMDNMLDNTALSKENYDNTLIGWGAQTVNTGVALGAMGLEYCTGQSARGILTDMYSSNWTISGDTEDCTGVFDDSFETTWTVGAGESITIPTNSALTYDYSVDWGDLAIEGGLIGDATHTYTAAGTYTVKVTGDFPAIYFANGPQRDKIQSVEKWGDVEWESFELAFYGCANLEINATDNPDLSMVINMASSFRGCDMMNDDISGWDVSNVENMSFMFMENDAFNQDISGWTMTGVLNTGGMFRDATAFDKDISGWDVAAVTNMSGMFQGATAFNQPIASASGWATTSVANMKDMFNGATAFNQDLALFDMDGVWDVSGMLSNSGLDKANYDATLVGWSTQNVPAGRTLGADGLFYCAGKAARTTLMSSPKNWSFVGDTEACFTFVDAFESTWQVGAGESITIPTNPGFTNYNYGVDWGDGTPSTNHSGDATHTYTAAGTYTVKIDGDFPAIYFNSMGDKDKIRTITKWGGIEWESMEKAFAGVTNLIIIATDVPDLSGVTNMSRMFFNTPTFNSALNGWDVSNVTDMSAMFMLANIFDRDLSTWTVSSVENMASMFAFAKGFNKNLSGWDVSSVTDMSGMFAIANSFNQDLSGWAIENVTTMENMLTFSGLSSTNYDNTLIGWESKSVQNGVKLGAISMEYCASETARNELINTHSWDIAGDTKICVAAVPFVTKWVTNTSNEVITIPVRGSGINYTVDWGDGSPPTTHNGNAVHNYTFVGEHTISITGIFPQLYIANNPAIRLKIKSIEQWGDNDWKSMLHSFRGAVNLVNNATDAPNLSSVTDMRYMFQGASSFDADLGAWDISGVTHMKEMLSGSGLSQVNYDNTISGWASQQARPGVILGATGLFYCNSETDRAALKSAKNWSFGGDAKGCPFTVPFITTWETTSSNESITIPTYGNGYDYTVNWGDGETTSGYRDDATHVYSSAGVHTIEITGIFPHFYMPGSDPLKLKSIEQWGDNGWQSMFRAFYGASNMINNASDEPDLSEVTNMEYMLLNTSSYDADLGNWDISNVDKMKGALQNSGLSQMNYDNTLIGWGAQSVISGVSLGATGLKYCAGESGRTILTGKSWNITGDKKVCGITVAFKTTWETTSMDEEIKIPTAGGGYDFTVDWGDGHIISGYTTSATHIYSNPGVHEVKITGVFPQIYMQGAGASRPKLKSIDQWGNNEWRNMTNAFAHAVNVVSNATDIPNVSNVTNMNYMFYNAGQFDGDLGGWDISNVTTMVAALQNSGLSTSNYDNTLIGWEGQTVNGGVKLGANGLEYCAATTERGNLITNSSWIITGDTKCVTPKQTNPNQTPTMFGSDVDLDVSNVTVYPNPTSDELNIEYNLTMESEVSISVRDVTGKILYILEESGAEGFNSAKVQMSAMKSGIYLLQVETEEGRVTKRVVKQQ